MDEKLGSLHTLSLRNVSGVVVLDFVVIPRHKPRTTRVGSLQQRIHPVLVVANTVVSDIEQLCICVTTLAIFTRCILINVVTKVKNDVIVIRGELLISREVAIFQMLTAGKGKVKGCFLSTGNWHSTRATNRACRIPGLEAIPVPGIGGKAIHFDMHAVTKQTACP